jgi:hypothetical protein
MLAGIREGVMIEISEETAKELIEALNSLVSKKHLDVPTHSIMGDEIKDIHQLSEIMGVPKVIAAKAVLETHDHKLQDQAKEILHVRTPSGAERYGQPIGSIIRRDIRLHSIGVRSVSSVSRRTPKLVKPEADDKISIYGSKRKRLWHITPTGTFIGRFGDKGNGGGGGADGLGGGMFGGFGGLGGLSFLKSGTKLPAGARKIGESYRFFPDGSRGKATRYVTKLVDGKVETWLVLSRYSPSGKLIKNQMAKVKPGESSDKVWGSIVRAFKPKGKK